MELSDVQHVKYVGFMRERRRIYDISVPIRPGMVVYEGDPAVHLERVASIDRRDPANVSKLDFGLHTGTHIDAPIHFIEDATGADALPLDVLVGVAHVIDAMHLDNHIDAAAIASLQLPQGTHRVIFKTRNSQLWEKSAFSPGYIALTEDAAQRLVEAGVRLVGIDYLSIAPYEDPAPTHRRLLEADVVIVEGLDLRTVAAGRYELLCLPLRIVGSDGSPARVLLRKLD